MQKFLRIYHLVMMAVWVAMVVPGLLWLKDSLWFVILLSLYANFAGDFSAYQASRAEQAQDES